MGKNKYSIERIVHFSGTYEDEVDIEANSEQEALDEAEDSMDVNVQEARGDMQPRYEIEVNVWHVQYGDELELEAAIKHPDQLPMKF